MIVYLEEPEERLPVYWERTRSGDCASSLPPDRSFRWLSSVVVVVVEPLVVAVVVAEQRRWMMLPALPLKAYRHPARIRPPEIDRVIAGTIDQPAWTRHTLLSRGTRWTRLPLPVPDTPRTLASSSLVALSASPRAPIVLLSLGHLARPRQIPPATARLLRCQLFSRLRRLRRS